MDAKKRIENLEWLRNDIIGRNLSFETPFGNRPLVYADYTASGRGLYSIENYLMKILQFYANSHTDDDFTGKTMTNLLHDAEKVIKKCVNAGEKGKIIFTESGTTGGITKLQEILGVFWPPATRERVNGFIQSCHHRYPGRIQCGLELHDYIHDNKPIVFVSPYEHHSNEIMWRQTLCEIIEIPLNEEEELDMIALEKIVSDPKYDNRPKIGSFSAASNVTGIKTSVYEVARILHKHNSLACFDFAACAPYIEIDMNKDEESYFDAIFLSPHKFLGGPGTSGVLVFNEDIYPKDLPPTIAAGGTVDYVSPEKEEFIQDIETREKPGTPGIIQAIRTALIFQLKKKVGVENIDAIEEYYYKKFKEEFADITNIDFYGPQAADKKIPIIPFNIKHKNKVIHPKLVTRLLNDLFGIQTRAGCSCAGPYGHHLMGIEQEFSDFYRCMITNAGYHGIKPGWVRLNLHYILDEIEFDYIVKALKFIAKYGHRFIPIYNFDIKTGEWRKIGSQEKLPFVLDIYEAYSADKYVHSQPADYKEQYQKALDFAEKFVKDLPDEFEIVKFEPELEELIFFYVKNITNYTVYYKENGGNDEKSNCH
jgi:selenocysteine lyase/cysteine desulfurase